MHPPARDHLELAGERIDMERAARLSGSRFAYLRGDLVMLELALVRWALEKLRGHGFEPVIPPVLVREQALYGTGFLPDTEQQIYRLPDDDLYLVGTSEVALASLHAGEILDAATLPRRYAGFSPCFRREAGAAGRDTRGIFRVHQFDKVEMFCFVAPRRVGRRARAPAGDRGGDPAGARHPLPRRRHRGRRPRRLGRAQVRLRGLAARPGALPRADLVLEHDRLPGAAARHPLRAEGGGQPETLHTLNGTAVAVGRTIIALLENGQREDGGVTLPAVLVPYGAPSELPSPSPSDPRRRGAPPRPPPRASRRSRTWCPGA